MSTYPPLSAPVFYRENCTAFSQQLESVARAKDLVGNLRLATVIAALAGAVAAYRLHHELWSFVIMLLGITLFVLLAFRHAVLFARADRLTALVSVNKQGLDRMQGTWTSFSDCGSEFVNPEHPFTSDLDIFGNGSLYQYLTSAKTWSGKRLLANLLDGSAPRKKADILDRQIAVRELAHLAAWRQEFACSACTPDIDKNPQEIFAWGEAASPPDTKRKHQLSQLVPLVTGTAGIMLYLVYHTVLPALLIAILQLAVSVFAFHRNQHLFALFSRQRAAISVYSRMMDEVDRITFSSELTCGLQKSISGGKKALDKLAKIIAMADVRQSPLPWFVANAASLWDIRCACALARWKSDYGLHIRNWFDALGQLEAMCSIAHLPFENPGWVFPEIDETQTALSGTAIAHPLIGRATRIANTFAESKPGAVSILTGSNMSGKSTFLRAIGCNLVLAYAGAPVCAESFSCGIFRIYTSMRTGDNLFSHTSTFYAELLRVKTIVDAARHPSPLLYLLDELFRGTNSEDRHEGAVALIHHLSQAHTLGFVATHDLALCSLAEKHEHISNYHFAETFTDNNIFFDYRLRKGPSTTRNALYLMRMAGIPVA